MARPQVRVTTYEAAGKEVATAEGQAVPEGTWTQITLPDPGNVKTGYFSIVATKPNHSTIAIDNLTFEKVEEETKKEKERKRRKGKERKRKSRR